MCGGSYYNGYLEGDTKMWESGDNMKVSILVPSLNVAQYIEQCLDSIIHQTLEEMEIICIDAGSTDGTLEILERFEKEDSRIQIIHSDIKSYGYQMNLGLAKAKGEYIGIVETDDFVELGMFGSLYSFAKQYGADVVFGDYYRYNTKRNENAVSYTEKRTKPGVISEEEKKRTLLGPSAIWRGIYRKTFLQEKKIVFLETPGASYQDTGFSAKVVLAASTIAVIPTCFYHYRIDNENSSVYAKGKTFFICDEMESIFQFAQEVGCSKKIFDILWIKKYRLYRWNLSRLDKADALLFVKRMQSEFRNEKERGTFESTEFDQIKNDIDFLLQEPKAFMFACHEKMFEVFTDGETERDIAIARQFLLEKELAKLNQENEQLKQALEQTRASASYKIGATIVGVFRRIVRPKR